MNIIKEAFKKDAYILSKLQEMTPEAQETLEPAIQILLKNSETLQDLKSQNCKIKYDKMAASIKQINHHIKNDLKAHILANNDITGKIHTLWFNTHSTSEDIDTAFHALQPGDVLMCLRYTNNAALDVIRLGQSIHTFYRKQNWAKNVTHAAIYIGNNRIMEAQREGVIISHLKGWIEENINGKNPTKEVLVFRSTDDAIAIKASEKAQQLFDLKPTGSLNYAFKEAASSIICKDKFGKKAKKDYLKWAIWSLAHEINPQDIPSPIPVNTPSENTFFCSHLVAWAYQAASTTALGPHLNSLKISLPSQDILTSNHKINKWISNLIKNQPDVLDFTISHLPVCAKKISPRSMAEHLISQKNEWSLPMRLVIE